jgi:hypothetical protein
MPGPISYAARAAVMERDNWQCQACGICLLSGYKSIQHRKARGVGGTNTLDNLVLLCGTSNSPGGCHLRCESRDAVMGERGFWVLSWQSPASVPILRFDGWAVLLHEDGTVVPCAPPD